MPDFMTNLIEKTIVINALATDVWKALTQPFLMKQWMGEEEMNLHIQTSWTVNSPITISGFHHLPFVNKGTILEFDEEKVLSYSHNSSLSRLADESENYSVIKFNLSPAETQTAVTLTITNFPTEVIYKHLEFYWQSTIVLLKKFVENSKLI
ncbi:MULTISPECIES: SRPBCC family protein [Niastella]|uniref:SRPBCC domain-containing protein n=1 Tax=Niastella soli TaxID=2821487 RepID=A0ABS3Z321_9BACT|nr:SRPBCC domain-containing protein [Niastella soli]MBO9204555.1 SRPBCC domain-containing protein [Niastella soli]